MEIKNKVFRDIYATGIKKPYINLSKAKFNKIFDYKLKKRVTQPGGATVTNKKKKTERQLHDQLFSGDNSYEARC